VSSAIEIREAEASDAGVLARLRHDFRAALHPAIEAEEDFLIRCETWMARHLVPPTPWRCWLAHDRQAAVGSVWLQLIEKLPNPVGEAELYGYVTNLYVRAASRGAGIGSALLGRCLDECEARGVESVFLWPTARSRPLYERHGFAPREDMLERHTSRLAPGHDPIHSRAP
jgi:GNAT superfamily N-acetyltransferase